MAPKRGAKSSAPPPLVASSAETESRSCSEELEDEETSDVSLTATSDKTQPALPEESEESETSDDEEEEEEEKDDPPRVESASAIKNQPLPQQGDESDEESETESDEDAPPTKLASEQKADDLKPPSAVETKKQGAHFRRVWSTEDEVRILKALAAYRQEHDTLPQTDALVDALAGSLDNPSFGSKELLAKVKALKSRFHTLVRWPEIPIKEHDRRLLDLSKIVWGLEVGAPKDGHAPREFGDMCETYPYLVEEVNQLDAAHPELFKIPFGMLDDETASKLDVKIKKERVLRTRVELRRGDLEKEVTKTLLELL